MYATRSRKVKTDRRDARALAEACVLGAYRPAHRLSDAQRHVRGRLGVRDALVRTRTRYISVIRALLRQQGYRVPSGSAEGFIQRVRDLPLPGRLLSVVPPLLAVMRHLNQQLAYSDERVVDINALRAPSPRPRSQGHRDWQAGYMCLPSEPSRKEEGPEAWTKAPPPHSRLDCTVRQHARPTFGHRDAHALCVAPRSPNQL